MTETAIQKDVETGEVNEEKTLSPREEMMAMIAEKAKKERDDELADAGHEIVDTTKAPKEEQEEEEVTESEIKKEEEVREEKEDLVEIKVDGEIRKVEKDKILDAGIRALQKESTADKRLEEATRLLRQVDERLQQAKTVETPSQKEEKWDDSTIAYALEHGDEEQRKYAIKQLRVRDEATPIETVEKRILDTMDFKEASSWFQNEYSDIVKDPYLFDLAAFSEDKARANGDTRSRKELYKEIGDNLRKWKGGVVQTQTMEQKQEKKSEKVVSLATASIKKAAPQEKPPKTTQDVIEEMRKRRGQA